MKLYEIIGNGNLDGINFGHFTTKELAKEAMNKMPDELKDKVKINQYPLNMNVIEVDGKKINITRTASLSELVRNRDKNNYITGYVTVELVDFIDACNLDRELIYNSMPKHLGLRLTGHYELENVRYSIVGFSNYKERIIVTFKVTGDISKHLNKLKEFDESENPPYDMILIEKEGNSGLTTSDMTDIMKYMKSNEVYPVEIENPTSESVAMGFITAEAAEKLDFEYRENSKLGKYVQNILSDVNNETSTKTYKFNEIKFMLTCGKLDI